jgi:Holliday junction resolvase RusA-like endonuclease
MDDTLSSVTVGELDTYKREIVSQFTRSVDALIKCGALLAIVRDKLTNDRLFRGFCLSLPFTYRSAYNYIRLHEHSVTIGIEAMLQSKIDATVWYTLPVDSDAATQAIEMASNGHKVTKDMARLLVQDSGVQNPQTVQVLEQVAEKNPKQFVSMITSGVVTDPVSGDDVPLPAADPTMIAYASDTDESERIKRQQQHIETSVQSRYSQTVKFFVEGQPIPKGRLRLGKNGVFTPKRTSDYETHVGWRAKRAMMANSLITGDCVFSATFYREGKRRADLDNLIKAVKDAMNTIVYQDDSQIVEYGRVRVIYDSDKPGVEITVSELAEVKQVAA